MDKKSLAELSTRRLLNLSAVYKAVDLNVDEVNTRLRRPRSKIPDEWFRKIEKRIMDHIAEIVQIAEIDLTELIPRLVADLDTHFQQTNTFANLKTKEVEPIGYITRATDDVLAIYLPGDVYKPRTSKHDSRSRFLPISQIFDLKGNLELTDRGRMQMMLLAKKEE